MNKIILLGNMTRNPKTTRNTAEDGSEVVITKFDLAVNRRAKRDGEADVCIGKDVAWGPQAGGICTGMSQNLIDAKRNRSTKTMVSNSEFMLLLDQGTMDKEAVEDLFDISSEQLACVNGAEPGTGLIRFGDKIVPFDNGKGQQSVPVI